MSKEIVKKQESALAPAEIDELFDQDTEQVTDLTFQRVKILRESALFETSPGDTAKTMTGHILYRHRASQYWAVPFDERTEEDSPVPVCFSLDGKTPVGGEDIQADLCKTCEQDKWGSDPKGGKGKACRNTIRLLFLADDAVLPVVVTAPPTSIADKGPLNTWWQSVPNAVAAAYSGSGLSHKDGRPITDYWWCHVELSLQKEKCGNGLEASILQVKTLNVLVPTSPEDLKQAKMLVATRKEAKDIYLAEIDKYISSENDADDDIVEMEDSQEDSIPI